MTDRTKTDDQFCAETLPGARIRQHSARFLGDGDAAPEAIETTREKAAQTVVPGRL
jgi:hypothetical protein